MAVVAVVTVVIVLALVSVVVVARFCLWFIIERCDSCVFLRFLGDLDFL